jgi:hypothetical protein
MGLKVERVGAGIVRLVPHCAAFAIYVAVCGQGRWAPLPTKNLEVLYICAAECCFVGKGLGGGGWGVKKMNLKWQNRDGVAVCFLLRNP